MCRRLQIKTSASHVVGFAIEEHTWTTGTSEGTIATPSNLERGIRASGSTRPAPQTATVAASSDERSASISPSSAAARCHAETRIAFETRSTGTWRRGRVKMLGGASQTVSKIRV
jgi:hypothetical protein